APKAAARPNNNRGDANATALSLRHALRRKGHVVARNIGPSNTAGIKAVEEEVSRPAGRMRSATAPRIAAADMSAASAICAFITWGVWESPFGRSGNRRTTCAFQ